MERQLAYRTVATIELADRHVLSVALVLAWQGAGSVGSSRRMVGAVRAPDGAAVWRRRHQAGIAWEPRLGKAMVRTDSPSRQRDLGLEPASPGQSSSSSVTSSAPAVSAGRRCRSPHRSDRIRPHCRLAHRSQRIRSLREGYRSATYVLSEAMHAQVLVLGAVFVLFALAAPVMVPLVLGPAWAPVARVFPFVAWVSGECGVSVCISGALTFGGMPAVLTFISSTSPLFAAARAARSPSWK